MFPAGVTDHLMAMSLRRGFAHDLSCVPNLPRDNYTQDSQREDVLLYLIPAFLVMPPKNSHGQDHFFILLHYGA
jgi:hypothetical protein